MAPRIFTAAVWTHGDQVDGGATLQGSGAYVVARPRRHTAGVALQILGKNEDVTKERSVTATLSKDEALQLAADIMDALDESESDLAHRNGGRHGP